MGTVGKITDDGYASCSLLPRIWAKDVTTLDNCIRARKGENVRTPGNRITEMGNDENSYSTGGFDTNTKETVEEDQFAHFEEKNDFDSLSVLCVSRSAVPTPAGHEHDARRAGAPP